MPYTYEKDGAAIYAESFATIRAEANLARFDADEEPIAVRMIHAAGMVGLEEHVHMSPGFAKAARAALENGAPILCDAYMVSEGVTRPRLPAEPGVAAFPDSVSKRAAKHMRELTAMVQQGHRAVVFFLVSRSGVQSMRPAHEIDPSYAIALKDAASAGVEILAYSLVFNTNSVELGSRIEVTL